MRQPRQRVLDITINGLEYHREQAWNRVAIEVQHDLSQEHPGDSVRVVEKYLGGARVRKTEDTE